MGTEEEDKGKGEDETKPKAPKHVTVKIVRAVDGYHHRNAVIQVPNDAYHKGLIRSGHLAKVN